MDKQVPTVGTENYIRYPMINQASLVYHTKNILTVLSKQCCFYDNSKEKM